MRGCNQRPNSTYLSVAAEVHATSDQRPNSTYLSVAAEVHATSDQRLDRTPSRGHFSAPVSRCVFQPAFPIHPTPSSSAAMSISVCSALLRCAESRRPRARRCTCSSGFFSFPTSTSCKFVHLHHQVSREREKILGPPPPHPTPAPPRALGFVGSKGGGAGLAGRRGLLPRLSLIHI